MFGTFQLNQAVLYLFLYRLSARPCALDHKWLNKHLNQEGNRQFISEQISENFIDLRLKSWSSEWIFVESARVLWKYRYNFFINYGANDSLSVLPKVEVKVRYSCKLCSVLDLVGDYEFRVESKVIAGISLCIDLQNGWTLPDSDKRPGNSDKVHSGLVDLWRWIISNDGVVAEGYKAHFNPAKTEHDQGYCHNQCNYAQDNQRNH